MRVPIQNALSWPKTGPPLFGRLDLAGVTLSFTAPDFKKYKMLKLAYEAAEAGPVYNIAYNASNEVAVELFMKKKIEFAAITEIVEKTLDSTISANISSIEDITEADSLSRKITEKHTGDYINI